MTDNKIHSWESQLTNDRHKENHITNIMKCYKYTLLFNSFDEMDTQKIQYILDDKFMELVGCSYSELRLNMLDNENDILELLYELTEYCHEKYCDEYDLLDKIEEVRKSILKFRIRDGYNVELIRGVK